jgi:hypothetical protein
MPSDRLLRFREYMAAFEGAADPAKSIEHGYYVHAPGQLLVDQIAGRIELRPNSIHLLTGGIGSGKTTQLLVAKQQLEAVEDLAVCYVDVSRYTDISQIEPGVLMTIVGLELINRLPEELHANVAPAIKTVKETGYGYIETKQVKTNSSWPKIVGGLDQFLTEQVRLEKIQHKGVLANISRARSSELAKSINAILSTLIHHTGKRFIFLCDGLDRIEDIDRFAQVIRSDIHDLKRLGIGAVVVGPLLFAHSDNQDTKDLIDYAYSQPCFDVQHSNEAQNFLANVIVKRLPEKGFFGSDAIFQLVQASGGVMRDLIILTQSAIEEVYIAGDETLEVRHIKNAVQTLAKSKMLGISEKEVAILRNHLQGENFVFGSLESLHLLASRRVLEYGYPAVRYAVHPAIVLLLQPVAA